MTHPEHHLELFAQHRPTTRRQLAGLLGPLIGLFLLVLVGGLVQYVLEGHVKYLSPKNQALILTQSVTVAVAAVGMTLVIISAGIDLSAGSVVALTAVTAAWVVRELGPEGAGRLEGAEAVYIPIVAMLAALAMGALVGTANGAIITGLRLPPFVATLGMMAFARGAAKWLGQNQRIDAPMNWISSFTSANLNLFNLNLPDPPFKWTGTVAVSSAVLVLLLIAAMAAVLLRHTRFGRHVFAIGSSEATARLCGVRVERTKIIIYALAGLSFGFAGVTDYGYIAVGSPTTAMGLELDIIAAVVIGGGSISGGSGTILGTMVGALLMAQLRNLCSLLGLEDYIQNMVVGVVIVVAVALERFRHRRSE